MSDLDRVIQQRLDHQQIVRHLCDAPETVVGWMAALQGQDYPGARWSIGLRLPNSTETVIEQAIRDRRIVRTWVMRGTLHLVAGEDARWMVGLIAPRIRASNARRYKQLELDHQTLMQSNDVIIGAFQDQKDTLITRKALFERLEQQGIPTTGQRGVYMLQRAGLDGLVAQNVMQDNDVTYTVLPDGKSLTVDESAAELAKRYFASRGPATLKDFTWWSGLTAADAKAGFEAIKPELTTLKSGGRTLWYAEMGRDPQIDETTCALLPGFDEYLLGYQVRDDVLDPKHVKRVFPGGGMFFPTMVIHGKVAGTWKRAFKKDRVVVTVNPFDRLREEDQQALEAAAQRYGDYMGMQAILA